jgi:hypothetical protein
LSAPPPPPPPTTTKAIKAFHYALNVARSPALPLLIHLSSGPKNNLTQAFFYLSPPTSRQMMRSKSTSQVFLKLIPPKAESPASLASG